MSTTIFTDDGAETNVRESAAEVALSIDAAKRLEETTIILTFTRGGSAGFMITRIVRWRSKAF